MINTLVRHLVHREIRNTTQNATAKEQTIQSLICFTTKKRENSTWPIITSYFQDPPTDVLTVGWFHIE